MTEILSISTSCQCRWCTDSAEHLGWEISRGLSSFWSILLVLHEDKLLNLLQSLSTKILTVFSWMWLWYFWSQLFFSKKSWDYPRCCWDDKWQKKWNICYIYIYIKHIYTKQFAFILIIPKHLVIMLKKYILFPKKWKNTAFAFMSHQPGNIMKWLHSKREFKNEMPWGYTFYRLERIQVTAQTTKNTLTVPS